MLQTLPLLLSQPSFQPDARLLGQVMALGFNFLRDKSAILKHAATATLQQAVALMFERAETEAKHLSAAVAPSTANDGTAAPAASSSLPHSAESASSPAPSAEDGSNTVLSACRLFLQDMILIAGGLPTQWMRRGTPVPRVLASDMIDFAIREHAGLFQSQPAFRDVASSLLVPLLLRQLPTQLSFPLLLRFFRIARATVLGLHTVLPVPCRALLSLFVRMVHACARGEDLGADAAQTLGRFGSAGARILKGAHRALGASDKPGSGSSSSAGDASGSSTPVVGIGTGASTSAPGGAPHRGGPINMSADEASIMAQVAAIPLGPMPLFKCVLLMETLLAFTSKPVVLCSLFVTYDYCLPLSASAVAGSDDRMAQPSTPESKSSLQATRLARAGSSSEHGASAGQAKTIEQVIDALCVLVYRLLILRAPDESEADNNSSRGGGGRVESFSSPAPAGSGGGASSVNRRRSRRVREGASIDASFEDIAFASSGMPARSGGGHGSFSSGHGGGGGNSGRTMSTEGPGAGLDADGLDFDNDGDEFAIYPGDIDIALEFHARRPLAGLSCADSDNHIYTSSAGGIAAAIAAAPATSINSAGQLVSSGSQASGSHSTSVAGFASLAVGAAFSFVSAAASTGTSLISSAASKLSGDKNGPGADGSGDGSSSAAAAAAAAAHNIDSVAAPSNLMGAMLVILALEGITNVTSTIASCVSDAVASAEGSRTVVPALLAFDRLPGSGTTVSGAAAASAAPGSLRSPSKPTERGRSDGSIAAASDSIFGSLTSAQFVAGASGDVNVTRALAAATYRGIMQCLSILADQVEGANLVSHVVRGYQALTYSCAALGLDAARDAMLVNLCRLCLPTWDPSPGIASIAHSLMGVDSRSGSGSGGNASSSSSSSGLTRSLKRHGGGSPDFKHGLAIRALLNLTHGLGGTMKTAWIVIIDTLDSYRNRVAAVDDINAGGDGGGAGSSSGGGGTATPQRGAGGGGGGGASAAHDGGGGLLSMLRDQRSAAADGSRADAATAPRVHALTASSAGEARVLLGLSSTMYSLTIDSGHARDTSSAAAQGSTINTPRSSFPNSHLILVGEDESDLLLPGREPPIYNVNQSQGGGSGSGSGNSGGPASPNSVGSYAFLQAAFNSLFACTIFLSDLALTDLIQALSELTITAFAESATAELTTAAAREATIDSSGATTTSAVPTQRSSAAGSGKAGPHTPSQQQQQQSSYSTAAGIRRAANANTDIFSPEHQAAADAHEIMAAQQQSASASALLSPSAPPQAVVSVMAGSVNTGASSRVGGVPATASGSSSSSSGNMSTPAAGAIAPGTVMANPSSTMGGMPSSTGAQPPFALTRLMETCAHNVWRLGAVWSPLSALLRVLARSPSTSIRRYGVTCLADLAIAQLLGLGASPASITSSTTNAKVVSQEALLSPFCDYWRSPYASSRTDALRALYRIVEEAGSKLISVSAGSRNASVLASPLRKASSSMSVTAKQNGATAVADGAVSPSSSSTSVASDGWAVAIGVLMCVAAMAADVELAATEQQFDDAPAQQANLPAAGSGESSTASLQPQQPYDSSAAAMGAADGLYHSVLPACIFEVPDRHASSMQGHKASFLAEAFRGVQLIADDFLDVLPPADLSFLIFILGLCMKQNFDVNLRLTSVGLLWKVSDKLARARATGAVPVATYESLWRQLFFLLLSVGNGSEIIVVPSVGAPPASRVGQPVQSPASTALPFSLHLAEFPTPAARQGAQHKPDEAEVRNSAVQSLFNCLVAHGSVMSDEMWASMFNKHLLSLIYEITTVAQLYSAEDSAVEGEAVGKRRGAGENSTTVRLMLHHSRDSLSKQWNETRTIAYEGLVRTMASCFTRLASLPWFFDSWTDVLAVLESSVAGRHGGQSWQTGAPGSSPNPGNRSESRTPGGSSEASGVTSPGPAVGQPVFLEPSYVSVSAVACLQELAMLVCVPSGPGRPLDLDDRYSFDMRIVDGALTRVQPAATAASSPPAARRGSAATGAPGPVAAAASSTVTQSLPGVDPALRDRMWSDVRSVLNGIVSCAAVTVEEEETVAVEFVDALLSIITAASDATGAASSGIKAHAAGSSSNGRPSSVIEDPKRFQDTLSMLWAVLDARRRYRWAQSNAAAVTSGARIDAEELQGPKIEIPTNAERAVLRALEKIVVSIRSVAAKVIASCGGPSALAVAPSSLPRELEPVISAWTAVLELLRKCSSIDDGVYLVDLVKGAQTPAISMLGMNKQQKAALQASAAATGAGAVVEVALPPPALAVLSLKLLQRMYTHGGLPDTAEGKAGDASSRRQSSASDAGVIRMEDAVQWCLDAALQRTFASNVTVLAYALMHAREITDRSSVEVDAFEASKLAGKVSSSSSAASASAAAKTTKAVSSSNPASSPVSAASIPGTPTGTGKPNTEDAGIAAASGSSKDSNSGLVAPLSHTPSSAAAAARRSNGRSLMLDDACSQAGLGMLVGSSSNAVVSALLASGAATQPAPTSGDYAGSSTSSTASSAVVTRSRDTIFPIKIWGFGLGGSYGHSGEGGLIIADASKTKRHIKRAKDVCDSLMAALVALIKHRLSSGGNGMASSSGAGADASATSSAAGNVDIWLSLLATLEVLVGFVPSIAAGGGAANSAPGASASIGTAMPGGLATPLGSSIRSRGPTDSYASLARFFESIVVSLDSDAKGLLSGKGPAAGAVPLPPSASSSSTRVDAAAALKFDTCQSGTDAGMWAAVARSYQATMAARESSSGNLAGAAAAANKSQGKSSSHSITSSARGTSILGSKPTPSAVTPPKAPSGAAVGSSASSSSSSAAPAGNAFDSLRGFIGSGSAVTPGLVDPILRSKTYAAAVRYLGWTTLRNAAGAAGSGHAPVPHGIAAPAALNTEGGVASTSLAAFVGHHDVSSHSTGSGADAAAGGVADSLEAETFLLSALLDGYSSLLRTDAAVTTHGFVALSKRLISLLVAGASVLSINSLADGSGSGAGREKEVNGSGASSPALQSDADQSAAGPSAATAELERRRRAFGRICFGALVQLSMIPGPGAANAGDGSPMGAQHAHSRSRSSSSNSGIHAPEPQAAGSAPGTGSVAVAAAVSSEVRAFSNRMLLHTCCRSLLLYGQLEVGMAQARAASRVAAGVSSSTSAEASSKKSGAAATAASHAHPASPSSLPTGPCVSLVVDACYMLSLLQHLALHDSSSAGAASSTHEIGVGSHSHAIAGLTSASSSSSQDQGSQSSALLSTYREDLQLSYRTLVAVSAASEPLVRYQVQKALLAAGERLVSVMMVAPASN